MNFYLGNKTYDFPSIDGSGDTSLPGTTTLGRFTGVFATYNNRSLSSPIIYDFPYTYIVGGSGALSFTNTLSGTIYDSPVNGYILGPGVEPGTIITSYTAGSPAGTITTNKPFAFIGGLTTTIRITGPAERSTIHTFEDLSSSGLLIPGIRIEGDDAFGATILEVELDFADRTKGTITTDYSFTATVNGEYTARTRYDFAPWPGGSKRVVTTTFPAVGFPTGGSGTLNATIINNNPTPLLTDGVYYGTFLKAMQFSKVDSSLLYAANQGYDGITQYSVGGDTLIASDKNTDIPNVDSFAVFPTTSEIIAVVPQPTTNNLKIYQNEY